MAKPFWVGVSHGLATLITASVVISLGLGPRFGLTTELIVGSAPPEKAGAASGVSETAAELGGALGIAVLGSVGVAIYRGELAGGLPDGVPSEVAAAPRDTIGAAVAIAEQLPDGIGAVLPDVARNAFVTGLHLTSVIAAVIAVVAAVMLRPRDATALAARRGQALRTGRAPSTGPGRVRRLTAHPAKRRG